MEKRKFSRVNFATEALLKYKDTTFKGEVDNLSLRGMFVKTGEKLQLDEKVEITIYLTGTTSLLAVNLDGIVARTTENGLGMLFEKIDLDSFIHLKNIVAYNSGDTGKIMEEFLNFNK